MATTPGQRFVRRHNAARTTTSNTTAADISYDTAVISEGGYSWSSPAVTVDTAGKYLCLFDIGEVQLASTRAVGTLVPAINGTQQTYYKGQSRYLRNSGGNHGASNGACILDLAASDAVKIRTPGAITETDAFGSYATNVNQGGGFQLIYLGDTNFTEVQRQSNQTIVETNANATRPWIDSTGTWTQITFTNEINDDDALYGGSGGDITLKADKKYVIVYGATFQSNSGERVNTLLRLNIDGTNVQYASGYERDAASEGPPMHGVYLHEVGGINETLKLEGTIEQEDAAVAITPVCSNAYVQVLELPDSAEWIHVDNSTTDSLTTALAGTTTYYDTPLSSTVRADGNSDLSLDGTNNAVQNDSGASLPVLALGWNNWDRDSGVSGIRKQVWSYWDNGGTRIAYGISGEYSRGQQGNDDCFHASFIGAATMDLANGADLSFVVRDPVSAANSDMGVYASANRHFLGVQVLNLDTLEAAGYTGSATVAQTLGAVTQAATATYDPKDVTSTTAQLLPSLTQTVTATYDPKDVTSTIAQLLSSLTQVVTGAPAKSYAVTVDQLLSGVTQTVTATYDPKDVSGTADQLLPSLTQTVSGTFGPGTSTGIIAQTLQPLTQTLSGAFAAGASTGSIGQTLSSLSQTVSGTFAPGTSSGAIGQTLQPVTQSVVGTHLKTHSATIEQTLFVVTQSAAVFTTGFHLAQASQLLSTPTQTITGTFAAGTSSATVSQVLPALTQALTGIHLKTYSGVVDQTLAALTQTLTGAFTAGESTGSITQTLPAASQTVTGTFGAGSVSGTVQQTLLSVSQQLAATFAAGTPSGTLNQVLPSLTQVVSGTFATGAVFATIHQTLPSISQVVVGSFSAYTSGAVAQTLPTLTQAVTGIFAASTSSGSVTQSLPALAQTLAGTFIPRYAGVVAQILPVLTQVVTGSFAAGSSVITITQTLPSLSQQLTVNFSQKGWIDPGVVPSGELIYEVPSIEQIIWG